MGKRISKDTRAELTEALRLRYGDSTKGGKGRILDEFVAVTGYHRKHAVRVLGGSGGAERKQSVSRRIYDEAVKEALIVIWEAADRICGKRLYAIVPSLVDAMERHGHLNLDSDVRERLLVVSAATIDRILAPIRTQAQTRKKRRKASKPSQKVPVRTFADWNEPAPGYLEIDFVAHCGGSMAGSVIYTLVGTDVNSGWTECVPLLAREQSLTARGLDVLFEQMPIPVLGIDSDNDGAFINDTLLQFCDARGIEFTRSRAYHKNDQAWIEQKNGAVVRRIVGHERFSGVVAGQTLAHLYQAVRLYVNFFQPSFKLRSKERQGAKIKKSYHAPLTPCDRLLREPCVATEIKKNLHRQRERLDPVELLHRIRESQSALAALVRAEDSANSPGRQTLEQFLSQLPDLWRAGEVRPTHRTSSSKTRHWRTREDPFAAIWPEVLLWLQEEPETTAKVIFERLQQMHPGRFPDGQLRTLQRRVREWRKVLARNLVYACTGNDECSIEVEPIAMEG